MIDSVYYRCEVCGATYQNRHDCAKCENYHARLPENGAVESAYYLPKSSAELPYPVRIVAKFADGRRGLYEFCADVTTATGARAGQ